MSTKKVDIEGGWGCKLLRVKIIYSKEEIHHSIILIICLKENSAVALLFAHCRQTWKDIVGTPFKPFLSCQNIISKWLVFMLITCT